MTTQAIICRVKLNFTKQRNTLIFRVMFKIYKYILILPVFIFSCFAHNIGEKFEDPEAGYLKVFVTPNTALTGIDMSGLAVGNCTSLSGYNASTCYCTEQAKANGFYNDREFRSWHSTADVDARCNILGQETNTDDCDITFPDSDGYGPWLEVSTYKKIFNSHTDLSDSQLTNSLQLDATGTSQSFQVAVTDTVDGGSYSGGGCNGTLSAPVNLTTGIVGNNTYWTNDQVPITCNTTGVVYCFEVPDL